MGAIIETGYPKLAAKGRLKYDKVREKHLLLLPEKVVVLNETAASILALCDGTQSVQTITETLRASLEIRDTAAFPTFDKMVADVTKFVMDMTEEGWVVIQHEKTS
ncbi:pyrroloquinoline quinone biosynthesis peptide chaperone PqqD [Salirhabdus sp. Marseille-P4669]|uniref:pyrroloquinoline quinone biosynthesis peptide chaperone PqqD n=1 Tax=Salirhabdus sp. Marseille-P4669 TaxID=2042310 RepID=UPI00190EE0C7|nr:pyrroloquinoline quinone biosynthesis peptide chaperone PqqD [Salirhabdus sp. Marseille-P4669]